MKLHEILAKEKKLVPTNDGELTELQLLTRKPTLFNGFNKKYSPFKEGDRTYPDESQKVQQFVRDFVIRASNLWTDIFDITVTRDNANMFARADVELDGKVLLKDVPVTSLLYLEKRILEVRKYFESLPTLDESETWMKDEDSGLYRSIPVLTQRTELTHKPIVLYDATDRHPAQTQLLQEQLPVGRWETVKQSGAIPATRKRVLLERIDRLIYAVKIARAKANATEAPDVKVGRAIFEYILAD
jgi:hypothetical protein